jgi:hypothetical protein
MGKKIIAVIAVLIFAFGILFLSVLRSAAVKYDFLSTSSTVEIGGRVEEVDAVKINYYLPSPGSVLPTHPLWPVKALRDKLWLLVTSDPAKDAELNLLFADKRLVSSYILFQQGNPEVGYTTLTKAEKYLESASIQEEGLRRAGANTQEFAERLVNASLKHQQIIREILLLAPDDAKVLISKTEEYPQTVYRTKLDVIKSYGRPVIENPF